MVYFNPNNFSVAVKETAAKVYVEDVYLGEFTQDSLLDVKKNAEFVIPLSGEIALSTLVNSDLKKLLKSQVFIRAEGKARIGKAGIFITKDIRYQGRHRLDATLFP
jgi:LEA14-like dessication related protein